MPACRGGYFSLGAFISYYQPTPTTVPGNNWRAVDLPPLEEFEPVLPVSVVVPYFEAPEALGLTLAALEGQNYRRDLFEVVVVDDGSREPLQPPVDSPLSVRVFHQEDLGFGLARARNLGARQALYDIILFLDCDMMPEAGWLSAHARWHHVVSDAVTIGSRSHVEVEGLTPSLVRGRTGSLVDLLDGRPVSRPEWWEFHMARTNELTLPADDIFRAATGGNLGVGRWFFELVGGFDESFTQWGGEDIEFGYRSYTRGGLLVPVREAHCWHQGDLEDVTSEEGESLHFQRAKMAHLIAHHGFRSSAPGRAFALPRYVVSIESGKFPAQSIYRTAEIVLGDPVHDLVVWIEERDNDPGFEWLQRELGPDPRVRFGPAGGAFEAYPNVPYHVSLPAGVGRRGLINHMRAKLGNAVSATVPLPDGDCVSMTRGWAIHRASRTGLLPAEFGETTKLRSKKKSSREGAFWTKNPLARKLARMGRIFRRLIRELCRIRSPRQAVWFFRWLVDAAMWRWVTRRFQRRFFLKDQEPKGTMPSFEGVVLEQVPPPRPRLAKYSLGFNIAVSGGVASQVLATSTQASAWLGAGRGTDLIVADQVVASPPEIPVVVLSEQSPQLSVPAFDSHAVNPVGWVRDPQMPIVCLGPARHLPAQLQSAQQVGLRDFEALHATHHVVDVAAFHKGSIDRAGTLAYLAGLGVVVDMVDRDSKLAELLGIDFYQLMVSGEIRNADSSTRESLSIRLRRLAHRDHSLRSRVRQLAQAVGLAPPPMPEVSILLATMRPHRLQDALAAVAGQNYPCLEIVLALHGEGFDSAEVEKLCAGAEHKITVVKAHSSQLLGEVLNRATTTTSGKLVTKFDDDDLYGPDHIWDLVLAYQYSQAQLVGKGAEYVYLADSDKTVHRFAGRGESYTTTIGGGAMLISRHDLGAVGGWRNIPSGVDRALVEDVSLGGGQIYRTHGSGYLLMRHGEGHTWETDDSYFLRQANQIRPGLDLEMAGITSPAG